MSKRRTLGVGAAALGLTALFAVPLAANVAGANPPAIPTAGTTPIKHLVVIFQENVSFDHYFGTYPNAANTSGEPFAADHHTPSVNGLQGALLTSNPNGVNPRRLDPSNLNDVLTCDQDHNYNDEQKAFDGGAMDKFVATVGTAKGTNPLGQPCAAGDVMNYYDGNTTTALWNYAQNFAMSDNSFGTTFGPSAPGAINLVSGNTGNVDKMINGADTNGDTVADGHGGHTLIEERSLTTTTARLATRPASPARTSATS